MIRVERKPPPADFDARVRLRGEAAPRRPDKILPNGQVKRGDWNDVWGNCLPDLCDAYDNICAYWSFRLILKNDATVDHYHHKDAYPHLAFRWENYRLACMQANRRKGAKEGVLDPFEIKDGWFRLNPVTWEAAPSPTAPAEMIPRIADTIDALDLNYPELIKRRRDYAQRAKGKPDAVDMLCLSDPFLASELKRLGWDRP